MGEVARWENCNYSHDWSAIDRKADRCWICGSLQHRKGECPVKHEAAGRAGTKQGGESQPQQQQQSQQQKPKVAAEKGVVEEQPGGAETPGQRGQHVQELLREATGLLKSLETVKAIRVRAVKAEEEFFGLLDGGATHALRQAKEGELQGDRVKGVTVELAAGTAQLWQQKDTRTLLLPEKVGPIVPLAGWLRWDTASRGTTRAASSSIRQRATSRWR